MNSTYLNSFSPVQPYFPRLLLRSPTKLSYTYISPLLLIQSTSNRYTIINSNICSFATPDHPTQRLPPDSAYSALPLHYGTSIIPACICLHIGRSNNPQLLVHLNSQNSASTADTIILCERRPFYSCPPIYSTSICSLSPPEIAVASAPGCATILRVTPEHLETSNPHRIDISRHDPSLFAGLNRRALAKAAGPLVVLPCSPVRIAQSRSYSLGDVAAFAIQRWTL